MGKGGGSGVVGVNGVEVRAKPGKVEGRVNGGIGVGEEEGKVEVGAFGGGEVGEGGGKGVLRRREI